MKQNLLLISSKNSFLKEMESLLGGLDYSLCLLKSLEEIESLEKFYDCPVAIIESSNDEPWLLAAISATKSKLKSAEILVTYTHDTVVNFNELKATAKLMAIHRPFEDDFMISTLLERAPVEISIDKLKIEYLYPVKISDLKSETQFDFDVFIYLTANKKCLLYSAKDSKLTAKQMQNFKDHKVQNLYIRQTDKKTFQQFVTHKLNKTIDHKITSDALRREEMNKKIKDLFVGFFDSSDFDYDRSQRALKEGKTIIGKFILETELSFHLFEEARSRNNDSCDNYDHATNVSIFATVFALALGLPDVETAAVGCLLHDVGLSRLPTEFHKLPFGSLTDAQKTIYFTHPMLGAGYLRNKNLAAADSVYSIIQQHHENFDGSGYPLGLKGEEIHILSRLCHIADQFDCLMNRNSAGEKLSPQEVLNLMSKTNQNGPMKYDQALLDKLISSLASGFFKNVTKDKLDQVIDSPAPLAPETAEDRAKRKASGGKPWRFVK